MKINQDDLERLNISSWPIWSCEKSNFPWYYEKKELCYIIKGDIQVETENETIQIQEQDFVTFPKGLSCWWNVKKSVKKHYIFE